MQRFGPAEVDFGQFQRGLGCGEFGIGLRQVLFKSGRIETRNDLTVGDDRVVVHKQLLDHAGNLAADLDGLDSSQLAICGNALDHVSSRDSSRSKGDASRITALGNSANDGEHHDQKN